MLHSGVQLDELLRRHYSGWVYQRTKLSDEYPPDRYRKELGENAEIVLIMRKGQIMFASREAPLTPEIGDTVLAYTPKPQEKKSEKPQKAEPAAEKPAERQAAEKPAPAMEPIKVKPA